MNCHAPIAVRSCFVLVSAMLLAFSAQCMAQDLVHQVEAGETIHSISQKYLENPRQYWRVQRHNRIADGRALQPGATVTIPAQLLRRETVNAKAVSVNGNANVREGDATAQPLTVGGIVKPGSAVVTGADGSAVIELSDGSLLRIPPKSEVRLDKSQRAIGTAGATGVTNLIRLFSGRVEALVNKLSPGNSFEITTRTAAAGVRGTDFRVSYDAAAQITRSEVLEGAVAFEGTAPANPTGEARVKAGKDKSAPVTVALVAGTGSVADRSGVPLPARALLAAPQLTGDNTALQERPVVRFALLAPAGAKQYRGQIGRDAGMQTIVAENVFDSPEVKFAEIDDGEYFLRVRAIDESGLEGLNQLQAFRLKARPEPPLTQAPAVNGKARGENATFVWGESTEGLQYRFQLARDAAFRDLVQEEAALKTGTLASRSLSPGNYFWRVGSVRSTGDTGPWSDVRRFTQLPPSAPPQAAESATTIEFSWPGESGQTFVFQVARDREFKSLIMDTTTPDTAATLQRPPAGFYFSRLRAVDADGFIGPFTPAQRFEVLDRIGAGNGSLNTGDGTPVRRN